MSLRVVLLDRDRHYSRSAEATVTAAGHTVVGHCDDPASALALLRTSEVDVVVIDPAPWGADLIRDICAANASAKPIVVSQDLSLDQVTACIDAGAQGFVSKRTDPARLPELILGATRGEAPVSQDAGRQLWNLVRASRRRTYSGVVPKPTALLSPREREVLSMLVGGHTYAEVAQALGIGLGTVQTHIKSLYRKLEVTSKAEAVTVALRSGLA